MENEIWKDVVYTANSEIRDYTGLYQVSNYGNVRSVDRTVVSNIGRLCAIPGKVLKKRKRERDGYYDVGLYKNGKCHYVMVHKLVASAFVPNPNNLPVVDHINTNKEDNRPENLRWVTVLDNLMNPLSMAKREPGKEESNRKRLQTFIEIGAKTAEHITLQFDLNGNLIQEFRSTMDVQRKLGFSASSIARCCRGVKPTAYGYIWRYKSR